LRKSGIKSVHDRKEDMRIGIHDRKGSFSDRWIEYCEEKGIDYKIVNCFENDIVEQLDDCDALMWHHHHESARDIQVARQLLFALEGSGKVVFPDFSSNWHFDDKVGQKYLFEAIGAPLVPSYPFYARKDALKWANATTFPKVFKLRGGAASDNVKLVKTRSHAVRLIKRAFGRGFKRYKPWGNLNERWRLYKLGRTNLFDVIKGWIRILRPTYYARLLKRDRGYVYFQEFIPGNSHDIRLTYVFDRIVAFRRAVRPGDFRASGSYLLDQDQSNIPKEALRIAFDVAHKLGFQSGALDFILKDGAPLIVEVCYAFFPWEGLFSSGYWDKDLNLHTEEFNALDWMVDGVLEILNSKSR